MSDPATQSQVLVVDDSKVIRRAAVKILQKEFQVVEAEDGVDAWNQLRDNKQISVVFTDLGMPNMDGYALLRHIRESDDPALSNMPVIIITGAEESEGAKEEVFEQGATDFISKPFDSVSLKSRAAAHINYRNEVQSLEQRASTDKVTGLLTEAAFMQEGEQALAYALRHVTDLSLVRIDIDGFPEFFVKYGKKIAEQILTRVASIIREGLRKEDEAARLGINRFALLLPSSDGEGATHVVGRICERVEKLKLKIGDDVVRFQFNVGVTCPELDDSIGFADMMQQADQALTKSADAGRCEIVCFQQRPAVVEQDSLKDVEVNLEQLAGLAEDGDQNISNQQLASAMRKLLPLIAQADGALKLGLSKVILHLEKRLK